MTRETRWYNTEKEHNLTFFYNMEDNIRSKFQLSVCDLQSAGKSVIDTLDWKNIFDFNINRFPIMLETV